MSDAFSGGDWRNGLSGPIGFKGGGSFRGCNFYVRSAKSTVGRRVIVHEFPGSDTATCDDLGQKVSRYVLEAYVLGSNYMTARDNLSKQFKKAGPGILIHPWWGTKVVTVDGTVEIEESWDHGGMAKFTLHVVEVGTLVIPNVTPALGSLVSGASLGLIGSALAAFAAVFAVVGFISSVVQAATNAINAVVSTLNSIKGQINAVMNTIDDFGAAISALADGISALIALPGQLAHELESVISSVIGSIENIGSTWDSYFASGETPGATANPSLAPTAASPASSDGRTVFLLAQMDTMTTAMASMPAVTDTTPAGLQAASNQAQVALLVNLVTVATVSNVAVGIPYGSATAAVTMREALINQMDALALQVTDDSTYQNLVNLRSAVYQYLTQTAANLPNVIPYTPPQTVPALVLAQQLYGAPTHADDITNRNDVADPCQVRGGVTLEVLSV